MHEFRQTVQFLIYFNGSCFFIKPFNWKKYTISMYHAAPLQYKQTVGLYNDKQ